MSSTVEEKDIRLIVDGLNEFIDRVEKDQTLDIDAMKNFMEPIFEQAGYRDLVDASDGWKDFNVLILHEAGAGDFITMSAGIREIRRACPTAHITMVVSQNAGNLAEFCPHVDELIVEGFIFRGANISRHSVRPEHLAGMLRVLLAIAKKLLRRRYDIAFSGMYSAPTTPILAYMAGARQRIGHRFGSWSNFFTDIARCEGSHAADKMLSYVEHLIGERITDRHLEAWFSKEDLATVNGLIPPHKKLFALGLGGGLAKNHYPPESYAKFINIMLENDPDLKFILLGGPDDAKDGALVTSKVDGARVVDLTGKISFRQTAAAISLCDIYIGNDTGSTHLAAATQTPLITVHCFPIELLPSSNLNRWYPYEVPSVVVCPSRALPECRDSKNIRGCAQGRPHCITQITPQNLFDAYKVLLEQIERGNKKYVLFDPENYSGAIEDADVRRVVDGFEEYIAHVEKTQEFKCDEMMTRMEPIFLQAGYRRTPDGRNPPASNIIIVHESAAGDFIAMSAAIREIRRAYPSAHITLIVNTRAENLAELCPHVDEIIVRRFVLDNGQALQSARDDITNIIKKLRFYLELAKKCLTRRYDICLSPIYGSRPSTVLLSYFTGAARRISHDRGLWSPLLTDFVNQRGVGTHAVDKSLSYVEHLTGERIKERRMETWFDQNDLDAVKALMPSTKKIFTIGVGGLTRKNHYPPQSYAELINLIFRAEPESGFVLLGDANDGAEAKIISESVDGASVIDLTGKTTFRQTAAAISLCDVHIGNDTATIHLAAAQKIPVLAIHCFPLDLGRTSPNLQFWYPYETSSVVVCPSKALPECRESRDNRGCRARGPHCITQITPQNLFDAYKLLLERIEVGDDHYVLFDPERDSGERSDVERVLDGFEKFIRRTQETQHYSSPGMKNFMEPIFERAGYRNPSTDEPKNILILHESAAGDFVSMSPMIREVRRVYPKAHITLVACDRTGGIAELCPHADEVIIDPFVLESGGRIQLTRDDITNIIKKLQFFSEFVTKFLDRHYDLCFCPTYGPHPAVSLLAYMSGAARRISYDRGLWSPLLTDIVDLKGVGTHAADKVLSCLEHLIGEPVKDRRLETWFDQKDIDAVRALLPTAKKFVAIGLGGLLAKNHYPPQSYGALINLLASENDDVRFILLGGSSENGDAKLVTEEVKTDCVIDLTGKTTFRQTAAAINLCDAYIGNDTGTAHLAVAVQTPVVVIHCFPLDLNRPNPNLQLWYPYGVPSVVVCPSHALPECVGSRDIRGCAVNRPHCITQITPSDMFNAYKILLDRAAEGNKKYALFDPEKGVV